MSIFGRIKNAIFGQAQAATPAPKAAQPTASHPAAPQTAQASVNAAPSSATAHNPASSNSAPASPASTSQTKPAAATPVPTPSAAAPVVPASPEATTSGAAKSQHVDVEEIMNAAVARSGQKLDWRHSIVDFMKALGMDASLEERKELAAELGYTGDTHDSAKMNMFLHKALMKALSENGGKVPAEFMD